MDPHERPAGSPPIPDDAVDVDAAKVIRRLVRFGFRAYLVGGCVRDLLLERRPKDFDIATSARPRQVRRLFRNSRIIGRRFRLVHIRFAGRVLEVATFRAPPPPSEGKDVYIERDNIFGTEQEDAFRRDFTINGLFYDIEARRVIDHVEGLADLEARHVRTIGDPDVRLREDPVRILRAAKFAGRLGFEIVPDLLAAARRHAGDLTRSSAPRILEELYRLLSSGGAAAAFSTLAEIGALGILLPEITPPPPYFLEALERLESEAGGDRDQMPQWLMLAVLLAPHAHVLLAEPLTSDLEGRLHEHLRPTTTRLTVARRDFTRARQCLAAQTRLLRPPRGRGCRHLARREFFRDALRLRRILGPLAGEEDPEALPAWERLAQEAPAGAAGPRRRRRRRRRGGRRRGGGLSPEAEAGKDTGCQSPPESSSAPAPPPPPAASPPDFSNGDS